MSKINLDIDMNSRKLLEEVLNYINEEKIETLIERYKPLRDDFNPNPVNVMTFTRMLSIYIPDAQEIPLTERLDKACDDFLEWLGVQGPKDTIYLLDNTNDVDYAQEVDEALLTLYSVIIDEYEAK